MKKISSVLTLLGLFAGNTAFADAYLRCANPYGGSVSIEPTSTGENDFVIRLPANDPALARLGLTTTEDYELRGTLKNCTESPSVLYVASCDQLTEGTPPVSVSILGLRDHDFKVIEFQSAFFNTETILTTTEGRQTNQVRFRGVLTGPINGAELSEVIVQYFDVPAPAVATSDPSQCL